MSTSLMIRLFELAYDTRLTLPILVSVAFMLADIHFRVELQFEARFINNNQNREAEEEANVA